MLSRPPGFIVQMYDPEWDVCNTEFVARKDGEGIARTGGELVVGVSRTGGGLVVGVARPGGELVVGVARTGGELVVGMARTGGELVVGMARTGGGLEELVMLSKNCTSATLMAAFVNLSK